MFALTVLTYAAVLAALCGGAGLLVDRAAGGILPGAVLLPCGAAALIALSQFSTFVWAIAPATPYLMAALALLGFSLGTARARGLVNSARAARLPLAATVGAYILALAPVLVAGRPTFSSYLALADSAVHMAGADFLIHHGQHYAHLDLRNSYGQYISGYYNTSYPSGADTLFGGSALLAHLPLIWTFQPFNAFMLATAVGPAWLLARRLGLAPAWSTLAALTATLAALVYGYELVGSVKEITALPMLLAMGALIVLRGTSLLSPRGAIPFVLLACAGVSALGLGFGVWVAAALIALAIGAWSERRRGELDARALASAIGVGAVVALLATLPTWTNLSGSVHVTQAIAATSNPGNLLAPLRPEQALGTWLWSSYKLVPSGRAFALTYALIGVALFAALLGALYILRRRDVVLGAWLALMLVAWLAVTAYGSTWVDAKALTLTSPVVVLLAWTGVASLRRASIARPAATALAAVLALALAGGALASDAMQYHSSNLAPTARYDELGSLGGRFAGEGPALFTDFDEYALYELRRLDVAGPSFIYPPLALVPFGAAHGSAFDLDRVPPRRLLAYPLIITRRDPTAPRPPAAYALVWQGRYYQVWRRRSGAGAALVHARLSGSPAAQCAAIARVARAARASNARLAVSDTPTTVRIPLEDTQRPAAWRRASVGIVMKGPGRLSARFYTARLGSWLVWLKGEIMRSVTVRVDGRVIGTIAGQLGGNSLNPNTMSPLSVALRRGSHRLSITRGAASLAPGDGGGAVLRALFLAPAGSERMLAGLTWAAPDRWRSLCGTRHGWVEAVGA